MTGVRGWKNQMTLIYIFYQILAMLFLVAELMDGDLGNNNNSFFKVFMLII